MTRQASFTALRPMKGADTFVFNFKRVESEDRSFKEHRWLKWSPPGTSMDGARTGRTIWDATGRTLALGLVNTAKMKPSIWSKIQQSILEKNQTKTKNPEWLLNQLHRILSDCHWLPGSRKPNVLILLSMKRKESSLHSPWLHGPSMWISNTLLG